MKLFFKFGVVLVLTTVLSVASFGISEPSKAMVAGDYDIPVNIL